MAKTTLKTLSNTYDRLSWARAAYRRAISSEELNRDLPCLVRNLEDARSILQGEPRKGPAVEKHARLVDLVADVEILVKRSSKLGARLDESAARHRVPSESL